MRLVAAAVGDRRLVVAERRRVRLVIAARRLREATHIQRAVTAARAFRSPIRRLPQLLGTAWGRLPCGCGSFSLDGHGFP